MTCWLNGEIVPDDQASVSVSDRGFLLGDGVFDTLLLIDGQPQYLNHHITRLKDNAIKMHIDVPPGVGMLNDIIKQLVIAEDKYKGRSVIRTTLSRGTGQRGLAIPEKSTSTLVVKVSDAPAKTAAVTGLSLSISDTIRRNEHSIVSQIKSLSYADNVLAMSQARQKGFDNAVFLNTKGYVACATNGNLYALFDEEEGWVTPPISDGVLSGTVREVLLRRGLVREKSVSYEGLKGAKAVCFSNSLAGVVPVCRIDDIQYDITRVARFFGDTLWEIEEIA